MINLKNIPFDTKVPLDNKYHYNGLNQVIYLEKKDDSGRKQYFLQLYILDSDGNLKQQGYLYFYLNFEIKESKFIGAYINPLYRNNGLASLLISNWIKLCLDNDIFNLKTNRKQRKPLLIYLLKNYTFEIKDISDYETSDDTISICRGEDDLKYLLFKNIDKKERFLNSALMYEGNYHILDTLSNGFSIIDQVLLPRFYNIQNANDAYLKAEEQINTRRLIK